MTRLRLSLKNRILCNTPFGVLNSYYVRKYSHRIEAWHDAPFFLIHIPKSAGMSICSSMGLPDPGHITFDQMEPGLSSILARKPCFAVVRHPYERIISTFTYAHKLRVMRVVNSLDFITNYIDINEFIHKELLACRGHYFFRPSTDFILSAKKNGAQVSVAEFSRLDEEWKAFKEKHKIHAKKLTKVNKSHKDHNLKTELNDKSKILINSIYGKDLSLIDAEKFTS